ncbi:MAG: LysM domain-containing protein [Patescibacteria group bacterium]
MGDEDRQQPPPRQPSPPGRPNLDKLGSEEAGLHEAAGSAVSMPEWADSLSHVAQAPPARHSRVSVDLAKRLREEEAARIARKKAEEEARRRAAAEAARRAKEEAARRQAAAKQAARDAAAHRKGKRVSKWPSILAALAVIALGAFVGQRIIGSETAPQEGPTPFPLATAEPTVSAPPAATSPPPSTTAQSDRLDTYTVKPGDTLESIAEQFGRTPEEISRVNGAHGGLIRVKPGQVINIP